MLALQTALATAEKKAALQVTYLGYLVVDLRWSRWVLSGDVVGQCCLRSYLSSV